MMTFIYFISEKAVFSLIETQTRYLPGESSENVVQCSL